MRAPEKDLGELSGQVAVWMFRGLKLIKKLFFAFISLYLPAIYMLMQATEKGVSSRHILMQGDSGRRR